MPKMKNTLHGYKEKLLLLFMLHTVLSKYCYIL